MSARVVASAFRVRLKLRRTAIALAEAVTRTKKFVRRPAADWRYLLGALALHFAIVCARRVMPRGPIWRRLIRGTSPRAAIQIEPGSEARVLWAVKTAARLAPFGRSCLTEAVTAHWLLAVAGCHSVVRFGVAPATPTPLAHAWLELNGRTVLGGDTAVTYQPLCDRGR